MKILVINIHSSNNAGDHVLNQMGIRLLHENFPEASITLAINDPASYAPYLQAHQRRGDIPAGLHMVDSFFTWFLRRPKGSRLAVLGYAVVMVWHLWLSILTAWRFRGGVKTNRFALPASRWASVQAYLEADMVVSCAGNFLVSRGYYGGITLLMPVFTIFYAWLVGKPVYMMPQSIGPFWRAWERVVIRWLLKHIPVIEVRDLNSAEFVRSLGFPQDEVHLLPDIAFLYRGDPTVTPNSVLRRYGLQVPHHRPLLGVTMIHWGAQNLLFGGQAQYEAAIAAAARYFVEEIGGTVLLFPQVWGPALIDDDRIPAKRVKEQLTTFPQAEQVISIDDAFDADSLKAMYSSMDLFIGSRLHSGIFALGEHVPTLCIAYTHKTWGVMRMLGLERWVVDIDSVQPAQVCAMLARLWAERHQVRAHLFQTLPGVRQQALTAGQLISDHYRILRTASS
jgi:colanic acid/amylovoran biosynthesis protein